MDTRYLFWLLILTIANFQQANAQSWLWAKSSGGGTTVSGISIYQEGTAVCTDAQGNVYMTGDFYGQTIVFGTITLASPKNGGIFLTKYDPNGQVLWAKAYGDSSQNANSTSICTDVSGNVIITGNYTGTAIVFDKTILYNPTYFYEAPFIMKSDPSGNMLWARTAVNITGPVDCHAMSTDSIGNIYVTGNFQGPSMTLGNVVIFNAGVSNIFLAKYDTGGNTVWSKSVAGTRSDLATSICSAKNGGVCLSGFFTSPALTFGSNTLTSTGAQTIFIANYDALVNSLGGKSVPTYSDAEALAMCSDHLKNIYLTGYFSGPDITFGSSVLVNPGKRNVFIVKYDLNGDILWSKSAGITAFEYAVGYSLASDQDDNIYLTGSFGPSPISFDTVIFSYKGGVEPDLFLIKYDSAGNILCASSLPGGGDDEIAVCTDLFGNAYVAGDYYATNFTVGPTTLPITTGPNGENTFLAKYVCGCAAKANITGTTQLCRGQNTDLTANGGINYLWSNGASAGTLHVAPDSSTTYSVIGTYGNCSDTAFLTVNISPLPVSTILAQHTMDFCEGGHNGSITTSTSTGTAPYTYSWSPGKDSTESVSGLSIGTYVLFVKDANGCTTQSQAVEIRSPELFVPTYFSPNHDGTNEEECVYGKCLENFTFSIYDRWGEKVFETNDPSQCWNGDFRGLPMGTQAFAYLLIATLPNGKAITKKGILNLVR